MAAKDWSTIRIPADTFDRQNRRRKAAGMTWAAWFDAQAPEPRTLEDVIRQAVREGVKNELAGTDFAELVDDEPEPLEPLIEKGGKTCLICGEVCNATGRAIVHLLEEHPEDANERHAEVDRRRRANGDVVEIEWAGPGNGDEPMTVNPDGPVSFGEVPVETPGEAWGNGHLANRECDIGGEECLGPMSKNYARVFARGEDGQLACPNCLSRSARYSTDAFHHDGGTDPAGMTGQSNPNAAVPRGADED